VSSHNKTFKFFVAETDTLPKYAGALVTGEHFEHCLIFATTSYLNPSVNRAHDDSKLRTVWKTLDSH